MMTLVVGDIEWGIKVRMNLDPGVNIIREMLKTDEDTHCRIHKSERAHQTEVEVVSLPKRTLSSLFPSGFHWNKTLKKKKRNM